MDSILEPLPVILLPIGLVYGYLELQARMGRERQCGAAIIAGKGMIFPAGLLRESSHETRCQNLRLP